MTRTQNKVIDNNAERQRLDRELHEIILEEFPVGTAVTWEVALGLVRHGVVRKLPENPWNHDIYVTTKAGKAHWIEARLLRLDQ